MNNIEFKRLIIDNIECIKGSIIIDNVEYKSKNLVDFIKNEHNYIFIGMLENRVIAFLYGYGLSRPDGKSMFYIHSIDVLPDYQEKGIGTKLMQYVINYIKNEDKYYKMWVLADIDNIRACKLYKKFANENEQNLYSIELK